MSWTQHVPFSDVADKAASVTAKAAIGGGVATAASPYLFAGVTPIQWMGFTVSAIVGAASILFMILNWRINARKLALQVAESKAEACHACGAPRPRYSERE